MSTAAVLAIVIGLVVLDLLATAFGRDSRPDIGQLPSRWFGTR
jgi:hypothetical protein